jgi:hypothetical protein
MRPQLSSLHPDQFEFLQLFDSFSQSCWGGDDVGERRFVIPNLILILLAPGELSIQSVLVLGQKKIYQYTVYSN